MLLLLVHGSRLCDSSDRGCLLSVCISGDAGEQLHERRLCQIASHKALKQCDLVSRSRRCSTRAWSVEIKGRSASPHEASKRVFAHSRAISNMPMNFAATRFNFTRGNHIIVKSGRICSYNDSFNEVC